MTFDSSNSLRVRNDAGLIKRSTFLEMGRDSPPLSRAAQIKSRQNSGTHQKCENDASRDDTEREERGNKKIQPVSKAGEIERYGHRGQGNAAMKGHPPPAPHRAYSLIDRREEGYKEAVGEGKGSDSSRVCS